MTATATLDRIVTKQTAATLAALQEKAAELLGTIMGTTPLVHEETLAEP